MVLLLNPKQMCIIFSTYDLFLKSFELTQGFEIVLMSSFPVLLMQNGMTPLHLAVWYSLRAEDCSTVKTLLEYNADCSAKDNVLWVTIA